MAQLDHAALTALVARLMAGDYTDSDELDRDGERGARMDGVPAREQLTVFAPEVGVSPTMGMIEQPGLTFYGLAPLGGAAALPFPDGVWSYALDQPAAVARRGLAGQGVGPPAPRLAHG